MLTEDTCFIFMIFLVNKIWKMCELNQMELTRDTNGMPTYWWLIIVCRGEVVMFVWFFPLPCQIIQQWQASHLSASPRASLAASTKYSKCYSCIVRICFQEKYFGVRKNLVSQSKWASINLPWGLKKKKSEFESKWWLTI